MRIKKLTSLVTVPGIVATALIASAVPAHAVDSISLEIGKGDRTNIARIGMQWKFEHRWGQSNGAHIGGYWDLTAAHWRGDHFQGVPGSNQHLNAIGITPVFRFQRDSLRGWYAEAGIGAHYLSEKYDNNGHRLSTHFQFGDHLGTGYVFHNGLDVGIKFQHFSNGSIKRPNDGVNFGVIRVSYEY